MMSTNIRYGFFHVYAIRGEEKSKALLVSQKLQCSVYDTLEEPCIWPGTKGVCMVLTLLETFFCLRPKYCALVLYLSLQNDMLI